MKKTMLFLKQYISLTICLFFCSAICQQILAQTQMELLSNINFENYDAGGNDIWGYVADDGKEYALAGTTNGVAIFDISTPTEAVELFYINGVETIWRDIKTWQQYAYVVNESQGGIMIVDLGDLPNNINTTYFNTPDSLIHSSHNIWIDEQGYAYVVGYNRPDDSIPTENRGVAIFDLANPTQPQLLGIYENNYVHDVFVRDNIMYTSETYTGKFGIVDISDPSNPTLVATQSTPNNFTHNTWLSDDSQTIFTSDERNDASIASYDISDWNDIKKLDQYKSSIGLRVMPHNVHVYGDFLVISYYADGIRVVDASQPDVLVETEYFDTSVHAGWGSQGCWGAFPFLPSGNIIGNDRDQGLFVVRPTYNHAAYLTGTVSNSQTGAGITDVEISLIGTQHPWQSGLNGTYKLGVATAAEYAITCQKYGYEDKILSANLISDSLSVLDVAMNPYPVFNFEILVQDSIYQQTIADAWVDVTHSQAAYELQSNTQGKIQVDSLFNDTFDVNAVQWGYLPYQANNLVLDASNAALTINLISGYYDDFQKDLGWNSYLTAPVVDSLMIHTWHWFDEANPGLKPDYPHFLQSDLPDDNGLRCYRIHYNENTPTRNQLISPSMDLSAYDHPTLNFSSWVYNLDSLDTDPSNVGLEIWVHNGVNAVALPRITADSISNWKPQSFALNDYIEISNRMSVFFEAVKTGNETPNMLAAIDGFSISNGALENLESPSKDLVDFEVQFYPNPFNDVTLLNVDFPYNDQFDSNSSPHIHIQIFNLQGRLVDSFYFYQEGKNVSYWGEDFKTGMYILKVGNEELGYKVFKLIKTE